jgi:DNA invertase Pin-like site-specific DNA recombinase
VIYLRVSLDATGEQLAVARHRKECRRIARDRGWTVLREYVDNSISATDKRKRRPAYRQMVDDYAAGEFDAIVCWDLDRLTRQPRELEDWIDAAEDRGLRLVTANGEADLSTDGGRMYARIKAAVARAEVERKAERQRLAAAQRAERGVVPAGVRLTGYTAAGELVPGEAETVAQMFKRFHAGDSLRGIAAWLNESGAGTRNGRPWNASTVRTILTNARYAGRAVYRGRAIEHPGQWEAIVDEATFDMVNARLADPRRRSQVGTDRKHLGAGLFRCAVCDEPVRSHTGNRYRCRDGHITRMGAGIDAYVLAVLRARLAKPDLARALTPPDTKAAKRAADEMKAIRARIVQTEADYDADLIDARRYATKIEKLRAELASVEAAQVRALAGSGVASALGAPDPVAAFEAAPLGIQRAVLDFLMIVRLHPAARGRKFDPTDGTVEIAWRSV